MLRLTIMPSLEVRQFAEQIKQFSAEDKRWLLQQLIRQVDSDIFSEADPSAPIQTPQKKFNITPAKSGSGYSDTAINHDRRLATNILDQSD